MDWLQGKYTVSKVLGSHDVELAGLPKNIRNVFHVDQLRRASDNPLPAHELHDEQPPPITTVDGEEEQYVEEILCARTVRIGKGSRRLVLVRWKGFADPAWEPLENLEETEALDKFEEKYGSAKSSDGPLQDCVTGSTLEGYWLRQYCMDILYESVLCNTISEMTSEYDS